MCLTILGKPETEHTLALDLAVELQENSPSCPAELAVDHGVNSVEPLEDPPCPPVKPTVDHTPELQENSPSCSAELALDHDVDSVELREDQQHTSAKPVADHASELKHSPRASCIGLPLFYGRPRRKRRTVAAACDFDFDTDSKSSVSKKRMVSKPSR